MTSFEKLIQENVIDHNVLHYEKKKKGKILFDVYSLNFAQISHVRTMTMFNKINCYLKTSPETMEYMKKKDVHYLFDNMNPIILKYNLQERDIIEGSKELIVDSNIISELKTFCPYPIDIEYVYLRKYTPNTKSKVDEIFRRRFESCGFRYFDIIFKEESIDCYKLRLKKVLDCFQTITENQKAILLFQEINPILNFCDTLEEYPCFRLHDPNFRKMEKVDAKMFSKSVNVLLTTKNFKHRIKKQNNDAIIDFFSYEGHEKHKNKFQNLKYYLPKYKLYLYNIHSFLFSNKKIIQIMEKTILDEMNTIDNFIIMGDFNFKFNSEYKTKFENLLLEHDITCDLHSLPYNPQMYEGILTKEIKSKISSIS